MQDLDLGKENAGPVLLLFVISSQNPVLFSLDIACLPCACGTRAPREGRHGRARPKVNLDRIGSYLDD
jgi:hypothetical protein